MFELRFTTGNAAFDEECGGDLKYEVTRILLDVSQKVTKGYDQGVCIDINGNKVGEWRLDV